MMEIDKRVKVTLGTFGNEFEAQISNMSDEQIKILCFDYFDEMSLIMAEKRIRNAVKKIKTNAKERD